METPAHPVKPKIEFDGMYGYLPNTKKAIVLYDACTHGGYAKHTRSANWTPVANFDSKAECLADLEQTYEVIHV